MKCVCEVIHSFYIEQFQQSGLWLLWYYYLPVHYWSVLVRSANSLFCRTVALLTLEFLWLASDGTSDINWSKPIWRGVNEKWTWRFSFELQTWEDEAAQTTASLNEGYVDRLSRSFHLKKLSQRLGQIPFNCMHGRLTLMFPRLFCSAVMCEILLCSYISGKTITQ